MTDVCPACKSKNTIPVLSRSRVPVHQNLVMHTAEEARAVKRGDLNLRLCGDCGLVSNVSFDGTLLSYGNEYDSNQITSKYFETHVSSRVDRIVSEFPAGAAVVEVGCGRGYFLRKLCQRGPYRGFGYDTSFVESPETTAGVEFFREYFGAGATVDRIDAVVCRHVIEHVPDPVEFLKGIGGALSSERPTRLYFETPSIEWILDSAVFWDVFYEHCCYFTHAALARMFSLAGFFPSKTERVFDGQYLWLEGGTTRRTDDLLQTDLNIDAVRSGFAKMEAKVTSWASRVRKLSEGGRLALWGAGAKGVTFANLLDEDLSQIQFLVDINKNKNGRYVPGTGHRILGPEALREEKITDVIVMNPNYLAESVSIASSMGMTPRFHVAD